jgi:hypothetical protein
MKLVRDDGELRGLCAGERIEPADILFSIPMDKTVSTLKAYQSKVAAACVLCCWLLMFATSCSCLLMFTTSCVLSLYSS